VSGRIPHFTSPSVRCVVPGRRPGNGSRHCLAVRVDSPLPQSSSKPWSNDAVAAYSQVTLLESQSMAKRAKSTHRRWGRYEVRFTQAPSHDSNLLQSHERNRPRCVCKFRPVVSGHFGLSSASKLKTATSIDGIGWTRSATTRVGDLDRRTGEGPPVQAHRRFG
jgi:hypothetical protein